MEAEAQTHFAQFEAAASSVTGALPTVPKERSAQTALDETKAAGTAIEGQSPGGPEPSATCSPLLAGSYGEESRVKDRAIAKAKAKQAESIGEL